MESIFQIIGVDECGRGCLYGDVVAAAVILPSDPSVLPPAHRAAYDALTDSKALSAKRRETLAAAIKEMAIAYGIGSASPQEIDKDNILQATMTAMHRAIDTCISSFAASTGSTDSSASPSPTPQLLLIDGTYFRPYPNVPHKCIVKGDAKVKEISAASILAKQYRDQCIKDEVASDPTLKNYGLHTNMGYGTQSHMSGLKLHGPTAKHRMSFGPVSIAAAAGSCTPR